MKRLLVILVLTASAAAQHITLDHKSPAQLSVTRDGHTIDIPQLGNELRVIVRFREARANHFAQDLQRIHTSRIATQSIRTAARITHTYSRAFSGASAIVDAADVPAIRALDYVASVHLDRKEQAMLDKSVAKISAPQVWASYGSRGSGVVVAIIDTGIDYNHPAFGGGYGPGHRVIGGHDFVNDDDDPMDDQGHGTHVAGIVGANGGGLVGVAPDVHFLAYKVLDQNGSGYDSDIMAAIERAVDPNGDGDTSDHANVVNLSLGRPGTPEDDVSQMIDTATKAGVVFCVAAGNDARFFTISTPANAPSAIAVGASDDNDRMASFSSKGPVAGSLAIKPEVVAPGVSISSAKMGGDTVTESGTSMATPHVAGVVALLEALHPAWTPAMIKSAIVQTADPLGNEAMVEGAGRVDAYRAAQADLFAMPSTIGFGRDRSSVALWTAFQTLTLTNSSSHAMSLSLDPSGVTDGITLDVTPSSFVLPPGQSQTITLLLQVDNGIVPAPREGSLAFGGAIRILGGAMAVHVPWAFVKAADFAVQSAGDEPFSAIFSSVDSNAIAITSSDIGERTAHVTVPIGEYDIELHPATSDSIYRWIFLEHQRVSDTATASFSPSMAQYPLVAVATDERGQPLDAGRDCSPSFSLLYPDTSAFHASMLFLLGEGSVLVSPLSDRFTILPAKTCTESTRGDTAYAGQFAPIRGVSGNVLRTIDASAWKRVPIRVAVPADAVRPQAVIEPGVLTHGATWALGINSGEPVPVAPGTVWTATGFMTTEQLSSACTTMTAEVKMAPPAPFKDLPDTYPPLARFSGVTTPAVRQTEHGIDLSTWASADPATYVPRPGEEVTFGRGLYFPQSYIWIEDEQLFTSTYWGGSLGETRNAEASGAEFKLYDAKDDVVQSAKAFMEPWPDVGREKYRFEVARPISVHGIAGEAHVTAHFDTTQVDHAPPAMTSLRLLDGNGVVAADLTPGANGSLQFSAIDYVPLGAGAGVDWGSIRIESTKARWRPHGSDTWRDLPYTVAAHEAASGVDGAEALGHPPIGTLFRCDLAPLTREPALIDLQLHFEDPAGNSYEYTLAPAFSVGVVGRTRAVGR